MRHPHPRAPPYAERSGAGARNGGAAAAFPGGGGGGVGWRRRAVRRRFLSPERKMAAPSSLLAWCVQHLRGDFGLDVGEEVVR